MAALGRSDGSRMPSAPPRSTRLDALVRACRPDPETGPWRSPVARLVDAVGRDLADQLVYGMTANGYR